MKDEEQKLAELENDPVSKLLGGLKRIDAPGDFDFRVKARIAKGRPVDRPASWLPTAIRLAVPLGLLLSVGGYFGYNALYSPNNNIAVAPVFEMQGASVATLNNDPLPEPVSQPANQDPVERVESNTADLDNKTSPRQNERRIVLSRPANKQPGGRSFDISSRPPRVFKRLDRNATVPAKDVLTSIGIEADATWKVGSVKQNSVAERSGLKAGDVIEAVNDQTLTEKSTFGNKFNSKSLRVLRDGKSVQIDLKP